MSPASPRRLAGLLLLVLAAALPGCGERSARARADAVRIGLVLPFEGEAADWADDVARGLTLGLGEDAPRVEFLRRNDRGDPTRAADFVYELAADPRVSAIVGPLMTASGLAAAERADALGVPLITPTATHDAITAGRPWVFRTCFTDRQQGRMMARFARARLGLQRVVIVKDISAEYSLGLAEAFADEFLRRWGDVVEEVVYRSGAVSAERLTAALEGVVHDAVYVPGYDDDVARVLSVLAARDPDGAVTYLGGDGWTGDDLRASVDPWPARLYHTSHFVDDGNDPDVRRFAELYADVMLMEERRRDGRPVAARANAFAALGYDTGALLGEVLREGGASRVGVREALAARLPAFRGVTGEFSRPPGESEPIKTPIILGWDAAADAWVRAE